MGFLLVDYFSLSLFPFHFVTILSPTKKDLWGIELFFFCSGLNGVTTGMNLALEI